MTDSAIHIADMILTGIDAAIDECAKHGHDNLVLRLAAQNAERLAFLLNGESIHMPADPDAEGFITIHETERKA